MADRSADGICGSKSRNRCGGANPVPGQFSRTASRLQFSSKTKSDPNDRGPNKRDEQAVLQRFSEKGKGQGDRCGDKNKDKFEEVQIKMVK